MKVGVLGTGVVGQTLAGRLVELGHEVMMGSRQAGNEKADRLGGGGGTVGLRRHLRRRRRLRRPGRQRHRRRRRRSTPSTPPAPTTWPARCWSTWPTPSTSPRGMPPTLSVCNTDSLAEQIQRRFPDARVVKTLNTVERRRHGAPRDRPRRPHHVPVRQRRRRPRPRCGPCWRASAGPPADLLDLGDIAGARGMEMYLPLWLRLWGATGTGHLNIKVTAGT